MKPSFGRKLFQLFLLSALVPTVVLTLTGVYLAVESSHLYRETETNNDQRLVDYYNDFLFDRIGRRQNRTDGASRPAVRYLDFTFTVDDGRVEAPPPNTLLPPSTMAAIERSARDRPRGFVEAGGIIYQYIATPLSADQIQIAGIIHTEGYAGLLQQIQADHAIRESSRDMALSYIYFVGLMFLVLAALSVAVAYFFSSRLSRSLSGPLVALSHASREIAAGDFKQSVPATGTAEIRVLIDNFNLMARRLETTTARLAQSERVAAWRSVARRFAHELKNPLQPILVSLYRIERLLESSPDLDRVREPLRAASEELRHLTNLADRFADLAKLPPPVLQKTNLNDLLSSIADLYREETAPFAFSLELPAATCYAEIDQTYFREALHNLLKNAVEASDPGGKILLKMSCDRDGLRFVVQDFGKGMSAEVIQSARMPYFTTREKGSGLGLAVVDKITSEMGGQLLIESQEGEGTMTTIFLPGKRGEDDAG
ncbi:MAG: ATP-binding protein [candidate division Zixibacteria bacterium]|nr:ATP-binding protein [candidate division Zixibacteria bacterium]